MKKNINIMQVLSALLGIFAVKQAAENAGVSLQTSGRKFLVSGTTVGGMDLTEKYWQDIYNHADIMRQHDSGSCTELMGEYFGFFDDKTTISTACSSGANAVLLQEAYLSEVIPGAHKQIKTLNVQMGETDITRTVWNRVTRTINIPSVEENLLITGEAVQFETGALTNRTVRIIIDYGTLDSSTIEIPGGGNYAATLSAPSGYVIDSVSVTMGSTDITDTAYDSQTSTVYIPDVSQNVTIYVSCDDA